MKICFIWLCTSVLNKDHVLIVLFSYYGHVLIILTDWCSTITKNLMNLIKRYIICRYLRCYKTISIKFMRFQTHKNTKQASLKMTKLISNHSCSMRFVLNFTEMWMTNLQVSSQIPKCRLKISMPVSQKDWVYNSIFPCTPI